MTSLVLEKYRAAVNKYGALLSIILEAISSKSKVNVQTYKDLCTELYLHLFNFPGDSVRQTGWIAILSTLHKGHSWELIERQNGEGLFCLDESGLEACNQILQNSRIHPSRKQSEESNMIDIISRMWLQSDPGIAMERMKGRPFCKLCSVSGHWSRYCPPIFMKAEAFTEERAMLNDLLTT